MASVSAEEYYKAHQDQEKEYVSVYTATAVKAGETVITNVGVNIETTAAEDGYQLFSLADKSFTYLTAEQFQEQAAPADNLELPVAKEDLTDDDLKAIKPVKKGTTVVVDVGLPIQTDARVDGFLVKPEGSDLPIFMSNFELTSAFNYAGKKYETEPVLVVTDKTETPLKGIILQEEVIFSFKSGEYTAPAGSLLYINPKDEDGYTVQSFRYTNAALRVTAATTTQKIRQQESNKTQHASAVERQQWLKKAAQHKQPKK